MSTHTHSSMVRTKGQEKRGVSITNLSDVIPARQGCLSRAVAEQPLGWEPKPRAGDRSIRVGRDDLATGARRQSLERHVRRIIDRSAVGSCACVTEDVLEEVDRTVGEEEVRPAGMQARTIVQAAIRVGVRVDQVAMGLNQRCRGVEQNTRRRAVVPRAAANRAVVTAPAHTPFAFDHARSTTAMV